MPPRSPKPEPAVAPGRSTTKPSGRAQKVRPVIYKSSALNNSAPWLVARADAATINNNNAIRIANAEAESVRDAFKLEKCGPEVEIGEGDDEATNARKYERRLLMNRHSAAASRVRREAYTKALEAQLVTHENLLKQFKAKYEMEKVKNLRFLADTEQMGPHHDANDNHNDNHLADDDDEDEDSHESDIEDVDVDVEVASMTGWLMAQNELNNTADIPNPSNPLAESQTEDNHPALQHTATGIVAHNVMRHAAAPPPPANFFHPTPSDVDAIMAQIPPAEHALFAPLKNEDLLFADTLPPMPPTDRLLECFLNTPAEDTPPLATQHHPDFLNWHQDNN